MGLVATPGSHTPKIAFAAPSADYTASDGRPVRAAEIDLAGADFFDGAIASRNDGTGAVAIAAATAVPGRFPIVWSGKATTDESASVILSGDFERRRREALKSTANGWSARP